MSENDPNSSDSPGESLPPRAGKSRPAGLSDWLDLPDELKPITGAATESEENVLDSRIWAELPRLEISDQASLSMPFVLPGQPTKLVPPSPAPPDDLLPTPPGMIVVNDDFARLNRQSKSAPASEAGHESDPPTPNGEPPVVQFRLPEPPPARAATSAPSPRPSDKFSGDITPEPPIRAVEWAGALGSGEVRPPRDEAGREASPSADMLPAVVYGMVLRNPTPVPMFDVRIEHDLMDGPEFLGAEPEPQVRDRRLVWDLGTVEAGAKHRIRIRIRPTRPGEPSENATALFRVHQCLESRTRILRPSLSVSLTAPEATAVGEPVPLGITVANAGPGAARDLGVLIALPDGMAFPGGKQPQLQHPRLGAGEQCRFDTEAVAERAGSFAVQAHVVAGGKVVAAAQAALTVTQSEGHPRIEAPPRVPIGEPSPGQLFVAFALAGYGCAVPAGNVREVCRLLPVTPRPKSADWLPGTVSVRRETVPLVDVRRFLGLPPGEGGRVLIVRAGDATAAFLVDTVVGIRYLTPAASGEVSRRMAEFAAGSAESDGRRLVLLNVEKILREVAALP